MSSKSAETSGMNWSGRELLRMLVLLMLGFYMFLSPFVWQGMGRHKDVFRYWRMFSAVGLGICDVEYFKLTETGSEKVDWVKISKGVDSRTLPPKKRRIFGESKAFKIANTICRQGGEKKDLRMHLRIAERSGWKTIAQGEENLCL